MAFRDKTTGRYPVLHEEVRKTNPQCTFPAYFEEADGFDWVFPAEPPAFDPIAQYREEGVPVQVNGRWQQVWVIRDFTPEQVAERVAVRNNQKAREVRAERNEKLKACDWTQVVDAPLTQSLTLEWQAYRQALRDVTAQAGFPFNINWPAAPA